MVWQQEDGFTVSVMYRDHFAQPPLNGYIGPDVKLNLHIL